MTTFLSKFISLFTFGKQEPKRRAQSFISSEEWERCGSMADWPDLRGRDCFAGVDVGACGAPVCMALYFPATVFDPICRVLVRYLSLYDGREGLMSSVRRLARLYSIKSVGFDPWSGMSIALDLNDCGLITVGIRQGFSSMNGPIQKLRELVLRCEIAHGGDLALRQAIRKFDVIISPSGMMCPTHLKDCGEVLALLNAIAIPTPSKLEELSSAVR